MNDDLKAAVEKVRALPRSVLAWTDNDKYIAQNFADAYCADIAERERHEAERALPQWHDRPTGPGLWYFEASDEYVGGAYLLTADSIHEPWHQTPCFGPIPPRSTQEDGR